LGIDAFDQPNVQESKDNTKKVLAQFKRAGKLPAAEAVAAAKAKAGIASVLAKAKRGAYFAIMAYTTRTPGSAAAIAAVRTAVRDKTKIATTAGYGPRFLHSTGQLHKGGPKTGLFLQVVQNDAKDGSIPGQPYSFAVLKQAHAAQGAVGAASWEDFVKKFQSKPRVMWIMVPAGDPTTQTINKLIELGDPGDIIVDGGNTNWKLALDDCARIKSKGMHYMDAGTSGGIWGQDYGYCLMVGAEKETFDRCLPVLKDLAPDDGGLV